MLRFVSSIALLFVASFSACGGELTKSDKKPRYETKKDHDPDGIGKYYMGREIAQVMSYHGASWLERPEREKEEHTSKLLPPLKIKPGQTIVDLGAGSGYYTFRLAELVGEKGKVYAVDIQKEMLKIIKGRMAKKGLKNIELVLSTETDPKLPENLVDLIFMVDVYHELSFPYEVTEKMVKSLKPGGRMVFVEYRGEDPEVPIKLLHKMTEKQVIQEMSIWPLRHLETQSHLPWQHVIIFEKKK